MPFFQYLLQSALLFNAFVSTKDNSDSAKLGQERIIGGSVAFAGQFRFVAAIYKTTNDGNYFCVGSLMNNQWILTSGYCVDGAILFTIYLGKTNLKNDEPDSLTVATDTYILHPNFNPLTLENDIGLIKLRMPITFNNYIKPIDYLPSHEIIPNLDSLMVMGWGQTSDELPEIVDELHYVYQVPLSNEECRLTYGDQITESMVCAGLNYNEGFCHGDTGAPLVRYTNGPIVTHMGIASFISQNGCNTPEPSGYTRTFNYVDWIRNVSNIE